MKKPPIFLRYPSLGLLVKRQRKIIKESKSLSIVWLQLRMTDEIGYVIQCQMGLAACVLSDKDFVWHTACGKAHRFLEDAATSKAREDQALNDAYKEFVPGKPIIAYPRIEPKITLLQISLNNNILQEGTPPPYKRQYRIIS